MVDASTVIQNKLCIGSHKAEDLVRKYGSPLYVYNAAVMQDRLESLRTSIAYPKLDVHFACKANSNLEIVKLLRRAGAYIETVSPGEIVIAQKAGYKASEIIFTSSNISKSELNWLIEQNVTVNLDSLTQLKRWGERKPNSTISIRLNQGIGAGHHEKNITGGPDSKFGIDLEQLPEVTQLVERYGLTITTIHQHIGSGILDEKIFMQAVEKLLETAMQFKDLQYLDFGGGFGVPYKESEKHMDIESLGKKIGDRLHTFMNEYGRELIVRFEPGRYLVAESGVLLVTVTDIKRTPHKTFVGTDSGFNHLVRPMMYDSYHQIMNASRVSGSQESVTIAGNICESGDLFATNRQMTKCKEDDILAILTTGAYGYSMASMFSSRVIPKEVLIEGTKARIIRKERHVEDIL
ncbi:MAG: diaminopimelate decarboxylase [Candidatus Levybacteria bacterium]|nr:diaminopimelate decarboxylase [Candidatus Levybacteria bacterium]